MLNATGSLVGAQLYGPYGSSRYNTGTLPLSIGFTGQRADSVTGLDYYNARYYDPGVGQFLSVDSVQGNARGMDPYVYVGDDPESRTDPTGQRVQAPDGSTSWTNPDGTIYEQSPGGDPTVIGHTHSGGSSGNDTGSTTQPTPSGSGGTSKKTPQKAGGCGGTSILGLCVKDVGKFAQGSAEVLGSIAVLVGAVIGLFQSGGLLWALAQAFQMFASGILAVIKNGINNILNSLSGSPSKGFKIFLNSLQFAADLAATAITIVSLWKNLQQIGKYPGKTYSTSWGGFWKTTRTLVAKGSLNATTRLAATTVGNFMNTIIGGDLLVNDGEQLINDIVSN